MSAEKIINTEQDTSTSKAPIIGEGKTSGAVDINHLLARVRKDEREEYKINFIFFFMAALLILIVGIILSF